MSGPEGIQIGAVPPDFSNFGVLLAAQSRLMNALDPERPPIVIEDNLRAMIASPLTRLVMAVQTDQPLETANDWNLLSEEQFLGTVSMFGYVSSTQRVAYFDHLATDPQHLRRGIARAIVESAMGMGVDNNIRRFDLTSNGKKEAAQAFWEAMGFRPRETNVWRREIAM